METEVGNFRQIDEVPDGATWNEETALAFFYRFIIPSGEGRGVAFQSKEFKDAKRIRAGILKWMGSKRRWVDNPNFDFDLDTFNTINKNAIGKLLGTTLGNLNANQYFPSENVEPKSFTRGTIEIEDDEGVKSTLQLAFGKNLGKNEPGLNVKDTEEYSKNRNLLIAAKNELEALKIERDDKTGSSKGAFTKKINDITDSISVYEELINDAKKPSYNDKITLTQVVNNDPNVESFYSTTTLMPETDEQKVALGLLREVIHKTIDEDEYNKLYGTDKGLSYNEFVKIVEAKEAEYLKIMAVPFIVRARLTGVSKDEQGVVIPVDMDALLTQTGEDNKPRKSLIQLADELKYPIKITEEDDLTDKASYIKYIKSASPEKAISLVDRTIKMWAKNNLEPLLNIQAKVELKNITLEERAKDDLSDVPVKMSQDTIEEFLLDKIIDVDNINFPGKINRRGTEGESKISLDTDATKTKFKMPISFKNKGMDFESAYARTIGADSRNVISSEQPLMTKIKSKGSVVMNYQSNIPQDLADKLPGVNADYQWKIIRNTLTNFYRAKGTTTTEERIQNKIKSKITRGLLGDLESAVTVIKEIFDAQKDGLDNDVIDLSGFSSAYWFDGNNFKFSVKEIIEKFTFSEEGESLKKVDNIVKNVRKLDLYLNRILDFIEENDEELTELEKEIEDEEDEEEAIQRIAEENKDLINEQRGAEAREEKEREQDEDASEGEEALARILSGEVDIDEYEDEKTGLKLSTLLNREIYNTIISVKDEQRKYDNLINSLKVIVSEVKTIKDSKSVNITTASFKKLLNEWTEMTSYTDTPKLLALIDKVDETQVQEELKKQIKEERLEMESFWLEAQKMDEFQIPSKADFVRLINGINLRKAFSTELKEDKLFNDARHGEVTASSKKLFIEIDYAKKKLYLKGKIDWMAKKESYIGYKIQQTNVQQRIKNVQGMPIEQARKIRNKKVGPTGRVQSDGLVGEVANEVRYEFVKEIRSSAMVLIGAVNQ
tara:strand:- start:1075 stop:4089 length:3015 start_codon:yes stop_codon:yes gene_type:complete